MSVPIGAPPKLELMRGRSESPPTSASTRETSPPLLTPLPSEGGVALSSRSVSPNSPIDANPNTIASAAGWPHPYTSITPATNIGRGALPPNAGRAGRDGLPNLTMTMMHGNASTPRSYGAAASAAYRTPLRDVLHGQGERLHELVRECLEKDSAVEDLRALMQTLMTEHDDQTQQLHVASLSIHSLRQHVAAVEAELEASKLQLTSQHTRIADFDTVWANKTQHLRKLYEEAVEERGAMEQQRDALLESHRALRREVGQLQQSAEAAKAEYEQRRLTDAAEYRAALRKAFQEKEELLRVREEEVHREARRVEEGVLHVAAENTASRESMEGMRWRLREMERVSQQKDLLRGELEKTVAALRAQVVDLEQSAERAHNAHAKRLAEVETSYAAQLREVQRVYEKLKHDKLLGEEDSRATLQRHMTQMRVADNNWREELANKEVVEQQLQKELRTVRGQLEQRVDALAVAEASVQRLRRDGEALQHVEQQRADEVEDLRRQLHARDGQLTLMQSRNRSLLGRCGELEKEVEHYRSQTERLVADRQLEQHAQSSRTLNHHHHQQSLLRDSTTEQAALSLSWPAEKNAKTNHTSAAAAAGAAAAPSTTTTAAAPREGISADPAVAGAATVPVQHQQQQQQQQPEGSPAHTRRQVESLERTAPRPSSHLYCLHPRQSSGRSPRGARVPTTWMPPSPRGLAASNHLHPNSMSVEEDAGLICFDTPTTHTDLPTRHRPFSMSPTTTQSSWRWPQQRGGGAPPPRTGLRSNSPLGRFSANAAATVISPSPSRRQPSSSRVEMLVRQQQQQQQQQPRFPTNLPPPQHLTAAHTGAVAEDERGVATSQPTTTTHLGSVSEPPPEPHEAPAATSLMEERLIRLAVEEVLRQQQGGVAEPSPLPLAPSTMEMMAMQPTGTQDGSNSATLRPRPTAADEDPLQAVMRSYAEARARSGEVVDASVAALAQRQARALAAAAAVAEPHDEVVGHGRGSTDLVGRHLSFAEDQESSAAGSREQDEGANHEDHHHHHQELGTVNVAAPPHHFSSNITAVSAPTMDATHFDTASTIRTNTSSMQWRGGGGGSITSTEDSALRALQDRLSIPFPHTSVE